MVAAQPDAQAIVLIVVLDAVVDASLRVVAVKVRVLDHVQVHVEQAAHHILDVLVPIVLEIVEASARTVVHNLLMEVQAARIVLELVKVHVKPHVMINVH